MKWPFAARAVAPESALVVQPVSEAAEHYKLLAGLEGRVREILTGQAVAADVRAALDAAFADTRTAFLTRALERRTTKE